MDVSKKRSSDSKLSSPKKQKTGKKGTPSKGKNDSGKPKRPASAYLRFMEDFRQKHLAEQAKNGGSTKIGDVAKAGGAAWGKMSDAEKKPYEIQYQKAKAEYDEKMKLVKPSKDENKPKRAKSAFLFFLDTFRVEMKAKGVTGPDAAKKAGEKWREMSESEKLPYQTQQDKAKATYDEEMKEYLAKNPAPSPQKKAKKSKARVQEESESEEEEDEVEEEDDDEEDEDEDEESD